MNELPSLTAGGADPNYESVEGVTALVAAVRNNRASTVSLLIDRGADVNKEDTVKGITPLKAAVEDDNCALVELLIKRGAAVDHVNRNGRTGDFVRVPPFFLRI